MKEELKVFPHDRTVNEYDKKMRCLKSQHDNISLQIHRGGTHFLGQHLHYKTSSRGHVPSMCPAS